MKYCYTFLIIMSASLFAQEQTFTLQDGTVIVGSVKEETETTYIIETKYGSVTLNKNELVQTEYEIKLKSGETFRGTKTSETGAIIELKTKMGTLNINKSDIINMKEAGQITQTGQKKTETITRSSSSLQDILFGSSTSKASKDVEFALGEERLTDTFFDPTAYVLDEGTLYLSGLSFGFGLSDKLMLTSRWVNFFWGDFNISPKYMLFHKGNWEKESALAIGGHFFTYWQPDKVIFKNGELGNGKYYGGYFPLHGKIIDNGDYIYVTQAEDLEMMIELFSAYTFSKARKGMRGRVSNTFGSLVQMPIEGEWPYRIFWSTDVDITPKLKMIGEVFYDPFFLDMFNDDGDCGVDPTCTGWNFEYSDEPITEDDLSSIRPIHFDFGFNYALNEHFRIGIHNQPPIIGFYWKF